MNNSILKTYATLLLNLATEANEVESIATAFQNCMAILSKDEQITKFFSTNQQLISNEAYFALVTILGNECQFPKLFVNFLKVLAVNGRCPHLLRIFDIFKSAFMKAQGVISIDMTTAYTLSSEEIDKFRGALKQILKRDVNLELFVDEMILGGFVLESNDYLLDASVANRFEKLKTTLLTGA